MTSPVSGHAFPDNPKNSSAQSGSSLGSQNRSKSIFIDKVNSANIIKSDGIFTIEKGQGITQAIAAEVGMTDEQANALSKDDWSKIMNEIDKQKVDNPNLYFGGNDINVSSSHNYVVHSGQVVNINLKGIWSNILNIVNDKLGTNFGIEDSAETKGALGNITNADVPLQNKELTEQFVNETPRPDLAGKQFENKEYDKNGYVRFVFTENGVGISVKRDENGKLESITEYNQNDIQNNVTYNPSGEVISYAEHTGVNVVNRDPSGEITSFVHEVSPGVYKSFDSGEVYDFDMVKTYLLPNI